MFRTKLLYEGIIKSFVNVEKCRYLGVMVTNQICIHEGRAD
jgi:hypothetical protein